MKVIAFKVDDNTYEALRKKFKNCSFRAIYEPITLQLLKNSKEGVRLPQFTTKNLTDLYIYVSQLKEMIGKITTFYDFDLNEVKK